MKTKKSLILLTLLSLAVTSCSFAPVRRPRNSSSNGDTISEKDSGGQNSNNKRAPTLVRDDYDVVEYLKLDDNLNVIGLNYVPDDGVLFIDYPISSLGRREQLSQPLHGLDMLTPTPGSLL